MTAHLYRSVRLSLLSLLIFLCGCSCAEIRREFIGLNIRDVEEAGVKYSEVIDKDAVVCYDKILMALNEIKASVIEKNKAKHFIKALRFDRSYRSCIDTTEVAILVKHLQNNQSEIFVFSENYNLARFVAYKVFSKFEKGEVVYERLYSDT